MSENDKNFGEQQEKSKVTIGGAFVSKDNTTRKDPCERDAVASFTIHCTMKKRWVSSFLAMLKYMEYLGAVGSSRKVTLFADGVGDFRPKFEFDDNLPHEAGYYDKFGDRTYDAG